MEILFRLKRYPIVTFLVSVMFILVAYSVLGGYNLRLVNYISIALAGLGIWVGFNKMEASVPINGHPREVGWIGEVLSAIGLFAAPVLVFVGMFLVTSDFCNKSLLMKLYFFSLTYCIVSFLAFDIHFIVKEKTIVFLEDRVLYPGEKYIMFPMFEYDFLTLSQEVGIETGKIMIECLDAEFEMELFCKVLLDIEKARIAKVSVFDYESFMRDVSKKVVLALQNQAKKMTCAQFMSKEVPIITEEAYGFPFTLDLSVGNFAIIHPKSNS